MYTDTCLWLHTVSNVLKDFEFKAKDVGPSPMPKEITAKTKDIQKLVPWRHLLASQVSIMSKANV